MGRAGRALFRADVRIVDWLVIAALIAAWLCATRALGGSRAEKQRAQLVSRRARLMFDHAYVRSPNRPLATIGFWYLDPLQRFSLRWCCDIMMAEPGRLRVIAEALSASQSPSSRNTFIANSLRGMKLMSLTLIAVANRGT